MSTSIGLRSPEEWRIRDAAPELLRVLRECQKLLLQQQIDGTTFEEVAEILDETRAAIAKAEGK